MELRIKVGATADASLTGVFRPFVASAREAQRAVEAVFGATSKGAQRAANDGATATARAAKAGAQAQAEAIRSVQTLRNRDHAQFLSELKEQEREQKRAVREVAAEKKKAADAAKKDADRAERVGSAAYRTFGQFARAGIGVGRDLASGFGLDLSMSGGMSRTIALTSAAGRATRSAFSARGEIAGAEDVQKTIDAVRRGGDEAKVSYGDLSKGLEDFVAKSADLETGNQILGKMGLIAQATGANVGDLMSAAGDVNRELGDSPDKAERLLGIMRLIAKQGAMGNVEIKDLAKYMGRVSSTAFMYGGDKDKNIGILGALAQVSMKGGQSSSAEATRSAAAFARDLTKGAALERFNQAGIDIFTDSTKTALRGPEQIITDFLKKSGGNFADLAKLFQNQSSRAVVLGFENIYKSAGGGDKGLAAVSAEFKRFSTSMSQADVSAQAKTALDSPEARAQAMQNRLDTLAQTLVDRTLPAFEKMAPTVEKAADALYGIISFGAENPGTMIVGAIVASIAKAQLAETVGGTLAKALGSIGPAGLAVGALAVAAAAAAIAISDYEDKANREKNKNTTDEELVARAQAQLKEKGTIDKGTLNEIARRRAEIEGQQGTFKTGGVEELSYSQILAAKLFGGADQIAGAEGATSAAKATGKEGLDSMASKMDALIAAYKDSKPKGPMPVEIVGGLPVPGPSVDKGAMPSGGVN